MRVSCPARLSGQNTLDIEWTAETGSAQDLIARRELGHLKAHPSEGPINNLTANSPSSAEDQCTIEVPSIASKAEPYVLPETPSVLSVGQRCMEEGFDFVWRAFKRPYFQKQPAGKKVYMDVKDYVPDLKSWHENIATPARVRSNNSPAEEAPAERLGSTPREPKPPRCAKTMLNNKDFSRQSCLDLLKSFVFASNRNNQSGLSADGGFPNSGERNVTLGAFVHCGMKGVTKRTFQHEDLTNYLIAFMIHNGSADKFTSISTVQRDNLRMKSDPRNHRTRSCSLITLGDFKGGEVWIEGKSPEANHKIIDHDDTTLTGRLVPLSDKATVFDSSLRYKAMSWDGERWTIMAYTSSAYDQLDDSQVDSLRHSGFILQDQKKEFPSSPGVQT